MAESIGLMDDLTFLRDRLPAYADYTDEDARHLVDKQIRAHLGEALSELRERLGELERVVAERLNDRIFACEFGDQAGIRAIDHAVFPQGVPGSIHAADRAITALADEAEAMGVDGLDAYLDRLDAAFAQRRHVIDGLNSGDRP